MNAHIVTMDQETALEKYQAALTVKHADSYEYAQTCANAYKHLAEGKRLISLSKSIQAGGFYESGLPRLAIARADRREVFFRWAGWKNSVAYYTGWKNHSNWDKDRFPGLIRYVNMGQPNNDTVTVQGYALVPGVPAEVRPKKGQLKDWYILWEVEKWFSSPQHMTSSTDPFLLEHIGGDLYAIIAEWDLTEVEKLILEEMNG